MILNLSLNRFLSKSAPYTTLTITLGTSWYFDSACCNHMTSNSNIFSHKHTPPFAPVIEIADGSPIHVSHVGSIFHPNIEISDTYLVLKLHLNLLFVGQFCDIGLNVLFSPSGPLCNILRRCRYLGPAVRLVECLNFSVLVFLHLWIVMMCLLHPISLLVYGMFVWVMCLVVA